MKILRIVLLSIFVFASFSKSQAQLNSYDQNYMYTTLDEDFLAVNAPPFGGAFFIRHLPTLSSGDDYSKQRPLPVAHTVN